MGNVCEDDGTPPPPDAVQVTIAPGNPRAFPCQTVALTATTTPASATVTWSLTSAGHTPSFTPTAGKTTTVTIPVNAAALEVFKLTATATASGYTTASATVQITTNYFIAESSGAAQPGETVTLRLVADSVPSEWSPVWTQVASDANQVTLAPQGTAGDVTFIAPGEGDSGFESTDLHFEVKACASDQDITGTVVAPIQVAHVVFDLPSEIAVGGTLDLDEDINPETQQPILTITGAPADYDVLFFSSDDGALPAGVLIQIDQYTGVFTVDPASATAEDIVITVTVLGTAGQLAEVSDTIDIVP